MVTPFSPQEFASPRSNSGEKNWLVTWETRWAEENARITKTAREFEKTFRVQQAREKRKLIVFEHGVSILEDQRVRWQVHEHFRAWQQWLASEKGSCQFQQLAGEHEQLKHVHRLEEQDASKRLESGTSTLESKMEEFNSRRTLEAARSGVLHQMWSSLLHSTLVATSLLVWRQFAIRFKNHRYLFEEASRSSVSELLFLVLRSWCNYAASMKRAAAHDRTSSVWGGLPHQLQTRTKARVYRVLDWTLRSRQKLELDEWCSYVLWAWHQVLGCRMLYCSVADSNLGLKKGYFFSEELVRRAWAAWLCELDACQTAANISFDIEQNARKILSARDHAMWIIDISGKTGDYTDMLSMMLCWRYFIAMHRMECALEQISIEQRIVHDEADILAKKLELVRSEASSSQATRNEERIAMRKSLSIVQSELVESRDFAAQMLSECSRFSHLHQAWSDQEKSCAGELASARGDRTYATEQLQSKLDAYLKVKQHAEERASECEAREQDLLAKQEQLQAEAAKHSDKRNLDLREFKAQAKVEISKHEQVAEELREARYADQQVWTSKFKQAESKRTQLEKELQFAQRGVTMATPRSAGYVVERQQLQRRLAIAESRITRCETSTCEAELQLLREEFEQATSRHSELSAKKQQQEAEEEEEREAALANIATANGTTSVPLSPFAFQRVHERGPLSPPRTSASRSPVGSPSPDSGHEQRDQDLRAMLDDFQRAVRAPRSPLSPSAASSPDTARRQSSPSFSISNPAFARDRKGSEDSLPSESIIQGALSPNQNTSTDTSVAQNLAQRLDEAPWMGSSASGESPLGSEAMVPASGAFGPQQSRLQWLLTPPESPDERGARTPPRRRSSSPNKEETEEANGNVAKVEVVDDARPRPREITAARAGALWRQQTLTEGDAERRTLQQRVEQMRRQINAERAAAAAPRRQQARAPMPFPMQAQMQSVGR